MNLVADSSGLSGIARTPRKWRRDYVRFAGILLFPFDVVSVLLAGSIVTTLYVSLLGPAAVDAGTWADHEGMALGAAAVLAALVLHDRRLGVRARRGRIAAILRRYASGFLAFASAAFVIALASNTFAGLPRGWMAACLGVSLLLTSISRVLVVRKIRLLERDGVLTETIAVVGAGALADRLIHHLHETRRGAIEILGVYDDAPAGGGTTGAAGTIADLIELAKTRSIDWIVLTVRGTAEDTLPDVVQRLEALAVPVGLCPENIGLELPWRNVDYVGDGVPVMLLADRPIRRWNAVIKSLEDIVLGGLITLVLLPVLAIVALAIKIDSRGPVIFKQRRHTFNNREFEVYKFRTMHWAPAGAGGELKQTARNDDRVTRVGRFLRASSIDELPQLFNVLQGDMSLVGPRPHAVNMRTENRLGWEITDEYAHRHRVKPGMTGWSQVNGCRGATDTVAQLRRRVELDLYYVENWSLAFDLRILVLTVREVLKGTNAY
jgi:Undecaprenyl-phosphate glucose phosphotransferase